MYSDVFKRSASQDLHGESRKILLQMFSFIDHLNKRTRKSHPLDYIQDIEIKSGRKKMTHISQLIHAFFGGVIVDSCDKSNDFLCLSKTSNQYTHMCLGAYRSGHSKYPSKCSADIPKPKGKLLAQYNMDVKLDLSYGLLTDFKALVMNRMKMYNRILKKKK